MLLIKTERPFVQSIYDDVLDYDGGVYDLQKHKYYTSIYQQTKKNMRIVLK